MNIVVKRALVSCYDKTNLLPLVQTLHKFQCEIISTGGTKKLIEDAGIPVTDISAITQQAEAFGGRVKTLSFSIAASLLYDRERDRAEAERYNVKAIDLVVCNFYPFEEKVDFAKQGDSFIEWIDIGGPTMVRAAAKNFRYVGVLASSQDYNEVIAELEETGGSLSYECRRNMMAKAFNRVADYDAAIATSIDSWQESPSLRLSFKDPQSLRYGENAHQKAQFFKKDEKSFYGIQTHQGKELSYNNILDIQAAFDSIRDLKNQACCIIKHNTPCGIAEGQDQAVVFKRAWEGDTTSAFGSIVIFNQALALETLKYLNLESSDKKFVEIIIAPEFTDEAKSYLSTQKNLRVITYDKNHKVEKDEYRFVEGALLVQDKDTEPYESLKWVTQSVPKNLSEDLILFGLQSIRPMRSNAIAIVRKMDDGTLQLLGMGCGQPNRVTSVRLAIEKASENLRAEFTGHPSEVEAYVRHALGNTLLLSEAFFPFADNIELCHQFGIRNVVQPGGSLKDKDVIAACDRLGLAMMFSGHRHFKH